MKTMIPKVLVTAVILFVCAAVAGCSTPKDGADGGATGDGGGGKTCKASTDCDVAAGEVCRSGKCFPKAQCSTNTDCKTAGLTCCNMSSYQCVACTPVDGGTDDGGDGGGGGDDGGGDGCQLKIDCPVTQWCKADVKTCMDMTGSCASDDECALNHLCNSFTKTCECVDDNTCANWPDNKTSCDPNLKQCTVKTDPTCNPACDANCKECKNGVCEFLSGKECCGDNDCVTSPKLYCDTTTYTCYEKHNCGDTCASDADCQDWCGGAAYKCSGSACIAQECTTDAECDAICGTASGSTCAGGTCTCNIPTGGLCADCSTDPTACDAAGLTCGSFTKTCTKKCASSADCGDPYGQFYVCNDMVKMCNCQQASCCAPACQAGQTCDEGATCTCQ